MTAARPIEIAWNDVQYVMFNSKKIPVYIQLKFNA